MGLPEQDMIRSSFRRGMLFGMNDHSAPDDSVKFANNMLPDPQDALSSRNGRARRQDTVIGTIVYDVFRWLGSDSSYRDIVAHSDGANMVYGHADGTGALNNTVGSLTLGNPVIGMQSKFRLFLNNGNDPTQVYVFDSTVQTRLAGLGVGADLSAITPTDAGAGSIEAGTYKYRITAVYGDDGESNPGLESQAAVTIGASRDINVHGASAWSHETEPAGMTRTAYNIYRNESTNTNFRFVAQIAAASTTYLDSTTQATVDGNELVQDNHNAPPDNLTGMVWWDYENRAIAWGEKATVGSDVFPNRLFLGEPGKPEIYKTTIDPLDATNTREFQDVPQEAVDNPVITVVIDGAFAYVFNRKGVRIISPTDVAGAYRVDMVANSKDHGIIGPKSFAVTDSGEIYYASTDGLRLIRGRLDLEVSPNTDSATTGVVSRSGIREIAQSLNAFIRGVPASLRQFVYAHEFRDQIHISMATSAITNAAPTLNNEVLIYDIATNGFVVSQDRNVYGWATINDSGNDYILLGCGYTIPDSAPTTTQGNFWQEYKPGQTQDEDAEGNLFDIEWSIEDFNRATPGFTPVKLDEMLTDMESKDGVVTVKLNLDNDRIASTTQFNFAAPNRTVWQDASHWQSDPANDLSGDAGFDTGVALTALVTLFEAVGDVGAFDISDNGANQVVNDILFDNVTTIEEVVDAINAALVAHTVNIHCDFVKSSGYFRFTHDNVGASNSVTLVVAPTGGGTDIATAALLGTGASEIVHQAVDVTSPNIGLVWWSTTVAAPTDPKHFWSGGLSIRRAPKRAIFHGEQAQMIAVDVMGNMPTTIYGYRIKYQVLETNYSGVI